MNETNLTLFWYWIRERESIRRLKESGASAPWTNDGILSTYHFCNVHREDDRGTKEIRAVVQEYVHDTTLLPWAYTIARLFNNANTLRAVLSNWSRGLPLFEAVHYMKATNKKVFHTAYLVSTCGVSMDKIDYVGEVARQVSKVKVPGVGLQEAYDVLHNVNGLGSFLAAQVVADLRNDRYLVPKSPFEGRYWSAIGPGSKKGLEFIFGKVSESTYRGYMQRLFTEMPTDIADKNIHAQDLQNCLCEFSKYMRYRTGAKGRIRYYQ